MRQLKQLRTWQQVSHEMAYSMVCCTTLVRSRVSLESALLRAMVQILAALIVVVQSVWKKIVCIIRIKQTLILCVPNNK